MVNLVGSGAGYLSNHGKSVVARAMYERGKGFVGAAVLVDQEDGHPFVVLHLLCQGIEVILKAMLLAHDYTLYKPRLRSLGHDLPKAAAAVRKATGLHVFSGQARGELEALSNVYRKHLLRYASNFDIFVDPRTIPSHKVLRHTAALFRYLERKQVFISVGVTQA